MKTLTIEHLGTILPTAENLARSDAHADLIARQQSVIGNGISNCTMRKVNGELRYYRTATRYAVVSRNLNVLWFDVRADGDYPVREK